MTAGDERITELWNAGKFSHAITSFCHLIQNSWFNYEKNGELKKKLSTFCKLVETECEQNPEVIFNIYGTLKKIRNWDDETLCNELRIGAEEIEDIKSRRRPSSEGVGLKMLYGLFPQMAV